MGKPSLESQKSLAAVVVTFNRADKLRNVLNALLEQTRMPDRIYVIDNASTDETPDVIGSFDPQIFQHVRLAENVGGAGGFNAGLRRAYEDGHDFFWISDDDAYPAPDAIEILEREVKNFDNRTEYRAPFACSRVDWIDGTICNMNNPETVWDWPRWYERESVIFLVKSCSFVSVLVSRWAVEEHGLPIKDYFIWQDDVEYTLRLSRSYPGLFCPDSRVVHDTEKNEGTTLAKLDAKNVWKYRYGVRNQASRVLRDRGHRGYLSYAVFAFGIMRANRIPWALRVEVFRALISGYFFRPEIETV